MKGDRMATKFKNVSPLGALDVPALGKIVQPGEVFEVDATLVQSFADQPGNFEPVTSTPSRGELDEAARALGLDPKDYKTKPDIAAAIVAAESQKEASA